MLEDGHTVTQCFGFIQVVGCEDDCATWVQEQGHQDQEDKGPRRTFPPFLRMVDLGHNLKILANFQTEKN